MNPRLLVPLLFAGVFAFAGGSRAHTEAAATAASTNQSARARRLREKRDGQLSTALRVITTKHAVRFDFDVVNDGEKSLELSFPNGQTHDIVVLDSIGREVWRWGAQRMFTQTMRNRVLSGGDTLRLEEEWSAPRAHGRMTAVALLKSTNHPAEQRVEFVLP